VFPGPDGDHIKRQGPAWARLLKRAGLADLRLHDLRRSLGSWQAIGGSSLSVIGKSLGHTSLSATAIYARLSFDPVRESVEKATAAMLEAGKALGHLGTSATEVYARLSVDPVRQAIDAATATMLEAGKVGDKTITVEVAKTGGQDDERA